jgi:hypothetical protein
MADLKLTYKMGFPERLRINPQIDKSTNRLGWMHRDIQNRQFYMNFAQPVEPWSSPFKSGSDKAD